MKIFRFDAGVGRRIEQFGSTKVILSGICQKVLPPFDNFSHFCTGNLRLDNIVAGLTDLKCVSQMLVMLRIK